MTWDRIALLFLQLSWTLHHVTAIERQDMYPYGLFYGDAILQEGDDETSNVIFLTKPMYFYEASFDNLYVSTCMVSIRLAMLVMFFYICFLCLVFLQCLEM